VDVVGAWESQKSTFSSTFYKNWKKIKKNMDFLRQTRIN